MKEIIIIGIDKFSNCFTEHFACKGLALLFLGYKVTMFLKKNTETLSDEKREYLNNLDNFDIIDYEDEYPMDVIREKSKTASFMIINPSEYNEKDLEDLFSIELPIYLDLANLYDIDYKFADLYTKSKAAMIVDDNQNSSIKNEVLYAETNETDSVLILYNKNGKVDIYHENQKTFIRVDTSSTTKDLYLYSSLFFAGFIYGYEKLDDINIASHYGISLVSYIVNSSDKNITSITSKELEKITSKYFKETY